MSNDAKPEFRRTRPTFGDIVETIAKHPKAYLMHGSFGEALAFFGRLC